MSTTATHDKFTGKHTTLDTKTPGLEEPEESAYAEPVSAKDRSHPFSRIHLASLSPLFPIFGIRKRRLQPLKQRLSHLNHPCLK